MNFLDNTLREEKLAYAYKLGKIKVYDEHKTLMDYGIKAVPQSFVYIQG